MSDLVLRLARPGEDARIADFINQNFDMCLPLINRADFYQFYYAHTPGAAPQFALAEQDGEILCAAGYILANQSETPDIWVSVWVAAKGHNGVGLELMDALSGLLNARVVACNNIRANTCVLYHFLGWQAERLPHYYLGDPVQRAGTVLGPPLPCRYRMTCPDPCAGCCAGRTWPAPQPHATQRSLVLQRRYFACRTRRCWQCRKLFCRFTRSPAHHAAETGCVPVVRLVDFIGDDAVLPRIGGALDKLLHDAGAEYLDCYNAGIPAAVWAAAGLTERCEDDGVIIPNYLTPPLQQNTEYYYFTNQPAGVVLFKADGDQDRPNLPCE
ncbi:MAG: hypothetical protein ACLTGG_10370 [Subdoligranulum sp.]